MAKPDQIADDRLRELVEQAHTSMRGGEATDAVRTLAEAYLRLLALRPEMLEEKVEIRPGREMLAIMRWPMLGANLKPDSVRAGEPEIEFVRERFATSEAITYYEFTLESAIAHGA